MRIIAIMTVPDWGLVEEEEFISIDEVEKSAYVQMGWAKPYDDTLPLPPKGLNDHELLSYPPKRFVIKDGSLYKSNTVTSNTWVLSEWDVKIIGQ